MAPKPSKTTTARWLARNSKTMALAMKCQINNQLNRDLPQHKPGKNWSLPTRMQLHLFCTTWSPLRTVLNPASWWLYQSGDSYPVAFYCRDVGPNWPNNKHGLEEHLWHVGSTTSTVASLRVARLGWLPSQAKLPLHVGWHGTRQIYHWPWNVKSTIVATCNFAASPFLHYTISTQDHLRPC